MVIHAYASTGTQSIVMTTVRGDKLPSWIAPTYIVSAVSFFVLAVILVLVSVSLRSDQSATASEIAQEMHAIRTTLGREE